MVLYKVEAKARLEGVMDLQPADARNYIWTVDVECPECPADALEPFKVKIGGAVKPKTIRGPCGHSGSIAIVGIPPEEIGGKRGQFIKPYSAKGYEEEWKTIVMFKVNNMTPLECHTPEVWMATGSKSKKEINSIKFNLCGNWVSYDEDAKMDLC